MRYITGEWYGIASVNGCFDVLDYEWLHAQKMARVAIAIGGLEMGFFYVPVIECCQSINCLRGGGTELSRGCECQPAGVQSAA